MDVSYHNHLNKSKTIGHSPYVNTINSHIGYKIFSTQMKRKELEIL